MAVLILHRPNGPDGGDLISSLHLHNALIANGIDSHLRPANNTNDLAHFDWIILYAACSPDWGLPAVQAIVNKGPKLAIVPMWYDRTRRLQFYNMGSDVAPGYTNAVAHILRQADLLLPSTMAEARDCWKIAGRKQVLIMRHGYRELPEGIKRQPIEQYVVSLGRVEKAKNQYMVAMACHALGYQYKVLGEVQDEQYAAGIKGWGGELMGHLPWPEALDILSRARVHALVSFGEAGGNANTEAAMLGVPGVLGDCPHQTEYFGDGGIYADPTDVGDIISALQEAWERPRGVWYKAKSWTEIAEHLAERMRL